VSDFVNIRGVSFTIPSGQSASNAVPAEAGFSSARAFTLFAPAALDATTFTIQVTDNMTVPAPVWRNWHDGTGNIVAPLANLARTYQWPVAAGMRILAGTNVAANRTWTVVFAERC
jgi:hypothetical protein